MRRDAMNANARQDIKRLSGYHGSYFRELLFYNSDRAILLNDDYTVKEGKGAMKTGAPIKGIGLEVETECSTVCNADVYANLISMVFTKLFPADMWRIERDGSLGGQSSAECITQVMSKAFIRNHYKDFKSMWDEYFPAFGITTQNNTCGMHVNVSLAWLGSNVTQQKDSARKLYYLVNKYYDAFKILFNRRTRSTTYCGVCPDWRDIKNNSLDRMPNDHYVCMNYSHIREGRIEIRLVGGQKNFACFRNTMETIFFLLDNIKSITWATLENGTIYDVFKGCNSYVYDRLGKACTEYVLDRAKLEEIVKPTVEACNLYDIR